MDIDEVIDRLQQAWSNTGLPPLPRPRPSIEQVLADIAAAIAPRHLPDELTTFWRRLRPEDLQPLSPLPHPSSPEFALHCWLGPGIGQPASLFPIARRGRHFTLVELAEGDDPGGTIFDWPHPEADFQITHPSLSSYLDQLATMLELGEYLVLKLPDGQVEYAFDPWEQWSQIAAVRLVPSLPLPRYGTRTTIGKDVW